MKGRNLLFWLLILSPFLPLTANLFPFALVMGMAWLGVSLLQFLKKNLKLRTFGKIFSAVGAACFGGTRFLFGIRGTVTTGGFMGLWDRIRLFGGHNDGFLVDGYNRQLSAKTSFESILTVGGMGRGKSSTFVIPNLFTINHGSFVITDTSGELYEKTSGSLRRRGYKIQVLNLIDTQRSEHYNPLHHAKTHTQISQVAHILINTALGNSSDPFWNAGGEKVLRLIIQCLHNRGNSDHINLMNVKHVLSHFCLPSPAAGQPSPMDQFVADSTINDPATLSEYQSLVLGNAKTLQSIMMTADAALNAVGNPDIANLTATSTIDFSQLRREKTALFVLVRQQDMGFYGFILNLFYTELFQTLMKDIPDRRDLPCYLLLDEFGHLDIKGFDVIATTARKHRVAFWIFIQSMAQLEARYGPRGKDTILDGLQTEIYLPGMHIDTARHLSTRMGTTPSGIRSSKPLMTADQIVQMKDHQALLFHSNKRPLLMNVLPYYKQWGMRRQAGMKPAVLPRARGANGGLVGI